ncbi:MAG: hypothetical protein KXJ53_06680 [Phenylobacterium sp.]|nr:hypothetical protein [Phenylobacterium sp.]
MAYSMAGRTAVDRMSVRRRLDAHTPFEAVRQRADVLASIRHSEYLFKRPEPGYEVELDIFRKTR